MDTARAIAPTLEKLKASEYGSHNLQAALERFHQDGFVVLKSVVDVAHVAHILIRT